MKYFFESPARQEQFRYHAAGWVGTPFIPHARMKGAGVDCVNLGRELYAACGLQFEQPLPSYTMDGGKHNVDSQLTKWIEASGRFAQQARMVELAELLPGDLLCFKIGRSAHHTGFSIGDSGFVHCLFHRQVMVADLRDKTFARILHSIWRPMEVGA